MPANLPDGTSERRLLAASTTISVMTRQMIIQKMYWVSPTPSPPSTNAELNDDWRWGISSARVSRGFTCLTFPSSLTHQFHHAEADGHSRKRHNLGQNEGENEIARRHDADDGGHEDHDER